MTIIEPEGSGFVVIHPDGNAVFVMDRDCALAMAENWYRERFGEDFLLGIADIDWR